MIIGVKASKIVYLLEILRENPSQTQWIQPEKARMFLKKKKQQSGFWCLQDILRGLQGPGERGTSCKSHGSRDTWPDIFVREKDGEVEFCTYTQKRG